MSVHEILQGLDGVRKLSDGWIAKCPAHDDNTPSLSITPGDNGYVLVWCFAGCSEREVVDALGLGMDCLFPDEAFPHLARRTPAVPALHIIHLASREADVALMAANSVRHGDVLSEDDYQRLLKAVERLARAAKYAK